MSQLLIANNAQTTLAGPLTPTSTTANLAAGTGALFPSPSTDQYFVMTLVDAATGLVNEIVRCVSRTGDTCIIQRGQEGTTPVSWLFGDKAATLWTAGQAEAFLQTFNFPFNFSDRGFQEFPTGMILQWGQDVTVTGNLDTVLFPVVFPTKCLGIVATERGAAGWGSPCMPTIYGTAPGSTPTVSFLVSGARVLTSGGSAYEPNIAYTWWAWGH